LPGKIEISPGSFSFGEAKENAVLHPQMFKRVFALDKSIVNNKKRPPPSDTGARAFYSLNLIG
jgi:hypothetical protein